MDYGDLLDTLARYRRPGTPVFAYHYRRLPAAVCHPGNVPALIAILEDPDLPSRVRAHAAGALGQIGDRRAIGPLLAALETAALRGAACTALGLLRAAEAAERLAALAPRLPVAQWALEQVRREAPDDLIEDLERGQLRAIGAKIAALTAEARRALGEELTVWLGDAVGAGRRPGEWLLTAVQYTAPPAAVPHLCRALELALAPPGRFVYSRLLRAVGALAPLEAVAPLADAVCNPELPPDHRQLAAVCLAKVQRRRGAPAAAAIHSHADRIWAELRRLEEVLATTPSVEPERPWHHYPGTPGWRAAGERAVAAMRRLLQGAGPPTPSTS
ncbi:MAG: HEAT repeat domain-containing protein [Gemmatimonadota bacterium]